MDPVVLRTILVACGLGVAAFVYNGQAHKKRLARLRVYDAEMKAAAAQKEIEDAYELENGGGDMHMEQVYDDRGGSVSSSPEPPQEKSYRPPPYYNPSSSSSPSPPPPPPIAAGGEPGRYMGDNEASTSSSKWD